MGKKKEADVRQFVTTAPTFHNGQLYPAGALITIDAGVVELRKEQGKPGDDDYLPSNFDNLADPADVAPTAPGPVSTVTGEAVSRDEATAMQSRLAELEAKLAALLGDGEVEEEEAEAAIS